MWREKVVGQMQKVDPGRTRIDKFQSLKFSKLITEHTAEGGEIENDDEGIYSRAASRSREVRGTVRDMYTSFKS